MSYNPTHYLRPEARPIPYWKHHKRAKATLDFIIRALKEAVDLASESTSERAKNSIEANRTSRIVFISGEPGAGKSSLYLTLKEMLTSNGGGYQEGYVVRADERPSLDSLKAIRWLDPLDLEVVGDEGENLLAAVLVRLFQRLEESSPGHSKECEDSIKKLEDLATDIGIAWEGNLKDRAATLDPDTFSTEVMRTQRARLGINERLRAPLEKLSEKECYGCSNGTLFLLPVDDFYLKPAASLNLLRLLRMISIPRLFFLVMGDIKTVEALFTEKSLADWTTVAGSNLFSRRSERLDGALTRARELRARYLRKLLPPGQRTEIEAMDWNEALDFEVERSLSNEDAAGETLEILLARVSLDNSLTESDQVIDSKKGSESFLKFLISPSFSYLTDDGRLDIQEYDREREIRTKRAKNKGKSTAQSEKELGARIELSRKRSAYSALQILDATPREIMDLAFALRDVIRQQNGSSEEHSVKTPRLLLAVSEMVNQVQEEQSFLSEKAQKTLQGILPTRQYSPEPEDIRFEMDRLSLLSSRRSWKQYSEEIWTCDHRSWDLKVNRELASHVGGEPVGSVLENKAAKQNEDDPFAKLPPRPAAWFILLHDLAWGWNRDSISGNLVQKLCTTADGFNFATKAPPEDVCGWAFYKQEPGYKHFPMPSFETVKELDHFLFIWSHELKVLRTPDEIAALWAFAGWIVFNEQFGLYAKSGAKWFKDYAQETGGFSARFKKLERQLRVSNSEVTNASSGHLRRLEKWLKKMDELPTRLRGRKKVQQSPTAKKRAKTSSP